MRYPAGIAFVRIIACALAAFTTAVAIAAAPKTHAADEVQRGKYIVRTAGCNDCHTPGYVETAGKVAEEKWLVGSPLGWRGPWGTTYASNLRLSVWSMSEDKWAKHARMERRPPMPWFNVRDMSERDVRAIYRYIRSLGPAGDPAPAWVPPERAPGGPYVQFPAQPK
jgi:mono/diheme cytochrome c family protein